MPMSWSTSLTLLSGCVLASTSHLSSTQARGAPPLILGCVPSPWLKRTQGLKGQAYHSPCPSLRPQNSLSH